VVFPPATALIAPADRCLAAEPPEPAAPPDEEAEDERDEARDEAVDEARLPLIEPGKTAPSVVLGRSASSEAHVAAQAAGQPAASGAASAGWRVVPAADAVPNFRAQPGDLPGRPTPLDLEQIGRLLGMAHLRRFGMPVGTDRLLVAWAHIAQEISRGASCVDNNFGNIVVTGNWKGAFHHRQVRERVSRDPDVWEVQNIRFRTLPTPLDGAVDYWEAIVFMFGSVLPLFDLGDARGAAMALCERGYCTGDCESYSRGILSLYMTLRGTYGPRLGSFRRPFAAEPIALDHWSTLEQLTGRTVCEPREMPALLSSPPPSIVPRRAQR
jgi:hypothetical protein